MMLMIYAHEPIKDILSDVFVELSSILCGEL